MRFDFLAGFMVEALVILVAAKWIRDRVLAWRGYDVDQRVTRKRSVGAATSQAGYLIGVLLGFLGALTAAGHATSFLHVVSAVAIAGLVAIVLQLVADLVSDKLVFRGVDLGRGPSEDVNAALAVGKAAVSIATGMVLRGAMSDAEFGLLARIAWFGVGQAAMVLSVLFYCRLTPYDDLAEIKRHNLAAGFPIAGILLAVGVVMEAAIGGKGGETATRAALDAGLFAAVSLLLVYALGWLSRFVLLPRTKVAVAIVEEKNVGAGIQEGLSFLLAALIVTFFLS